MLQDVLDVLVSTQPYIPVGYIEPGRDAYLDLAKQLHKGAPSLEGLFVPKNRLESILALILATNFMDGLLLADPHLESVVCSMAASFCSEVNPGSDTSTHPTQVFTPTGECTWPMFRYAADELLVSCPHLSTVCIMPLILLSLTCSILCLTFSAQSFSIRCARTMLTRATSLLPNLAQYSLTLAWPSWRLSCSTQFA